MPTIVPVVEGPGDVSSLPQLLLRILLQRHRRPDVLVAHGKGQVVNANGGSKLERDLEKFLRHAQNKSGCGGILVLVDADDDCPVTKFHEMSQRFEQSGIRVPVQVVCAHREYESWFLASLDTIKGKHNIPETAVLASSAEAIADPKKWLSDHMPHGMVYKETTHQASFTASIDLELAFQNSRSFQRLCHALEQLVDAMDQAVPSSPTG